MNQVRFCRRKSVEFMLRLFSTRPAKADTLIRGKAILRTSMCPTFAASYVRVNEDKRKTHSMCPWWVCRWCPASTSSFSCPCRRVSLWTSKNSARISLGFTALRGDAQSPPIRGKSPSRLRPLTRKSTVAHPALNYLQMLLQGWTWGKNPIERLGRAAFWIWRKGMAEGGVAAKKGPSYRRDTRGWTAAINSYFTLSEGESLMSSC